MVSGSGDLSLLHLTFPSPPDLVSGVRSHRSEAKFSDSFPRVGLTFLVVPRKLPGSRKRCARIPHPEGGQRPRRRC